jgi:hypothetical protein
VVGGAGRSGGRQKQHQELSEDPHDFVATHLVRASQYLAGSGRYFASLHWHRQTRARSSPAREQTWGVPIDDCHFGGVLFAIRPLSHSVAMMLLTLFDVVVILLTWLEYGKQRSRRQTENRPGQRNSRGCPGARIGWRVGSANALFGSIAYSIADNRPKHTRYGIWGSPLCGSF